MEMYRSLVPWYPLIDPRQAHEAEAAMLLATIRAHANRPVRTLLELGSGAGNTAWFLKQALSPTLVDLSPQMLALSEDQNPLVPHHEGDMRAVRLNTQFDAVLIHDAICYLTTEDDVRATLRTVAAHLRPGGVAVLAPDALADGFEAYTELDEHVEGDRSARVMAYSWKPDPHAALCRVDWVFMLQDGPDLQVVHETHMEGLFLRATWEALSREAGLRPQWVSRVVEGETLTDVLVLKP